MAGPDFAVCLRRPGHEDCAGLLAKSKTSLRLSFLVAYGLFPLFLFTGFFLVGVSEMQMYGFDADDPGHWFGFFILYFSPFGLPLILGTPIVLLLDFLRKPWRQS